MGIIACCKKTLTIFYSLFSTLSHLSEVVVLSRSPLSFLFSLFSFLSSPSKKSLLSLAPHLSCPSPWLRFFFNSLRSALMHRWGYDRWLWVLMWLWVCNVECGLKWKWIGEAHWWSHHPLSSIYFSYFIFIFIFMFLFFSSMTESLFVYWFQWWWWRAVGVMDSSGRMRGDGLFCLVFFFNKFF